MIMIGQTTVVSRKMKRPTKRSQNVTERWPKIRLFLKKSALFDHPLCRQVDVLWWKMIARHHSKVHRTAGTLRVFWGWF